MIKHCLGSPKGANLLKHLVRLKVDPLKLQGYQERVGPRRFESCQPKSFGPTLGIGH